MDQIAVVYWSGTGNTEAMAQAVAEGARGAGAKVDLLGPGEFSAGSLDAYGAVAFGCPAMGSEELEDSEFEPMFSGVEASLSGKKLALFGSYGWGDGEWMRTWCDRCVKAGAELYDQEGLIVNEAPDEAALETCKSLGSGLANW